MDAGRSQRVCTPITYHGTRWLVAGEVPRSVGNRHPSIAPYGSFACADGEITIAVGSEGLWRRFAPVVWLDPADQRFATNADRVRRIDELATAMAPALTSATAREWMKRLDEAGVLAVRFSTPRPGLRLGAGGPPRPWSPGQRRRAAATPVHASSGRGAGHELRGRARDQSARPVPRVVTQLATRRTVVVGLRFPKLLPSEASPITR
ncbi:MAG: CoA transferase [Egibacteraceae bacterium]